jgi:hypothetical protein
MSHRANRHDTKAIVPVQRGLADGGFRGPAMGDLGYRGKRLAEAGQALGRRAVVTVEPDEICFQDQFCQFRQIIPRRLLIAPISSEAKLTQLDL